MSIFSSARTKWRTPKEQRPLFRQLAGTMGQKNAEAFLNLVYDTTKDAGSLEILTDAMIDDFMRQELTNVNNKRAYVDNLLSQARNGILLTELNHNLMPEANYYSNALLSGTSAGKAWTAIEQQEPVGKALARKKAAFWICNPSPGQYKLDELQKIRAILKEYIPDTDSSGVLGPGLGPNSMGIRKIHKTLCPDAQPHRLNFQPVAYPSTIGGSYLLDYIFQQVSGLRLPPSQDTRWVNAALFFMGAIGTVQCFTDGNKRLARTAYTIVLINGGFLFKAPTSQYESTLYRMNG